MRPWFYRPHPSHCLDSTLLDEDFDDFGGTLTFKQICEPQGQLCADTPGTGDPDLTKGLGRPPRNVQPSWKDVQLAKAQEQDRRTPRSKLDWKCRCCVPYNGHHTPDYWGTGQKDIW